MSEPKSKTVTEPLRKMSENGRGGKVSLAEWENERTFTNKNADGEITNERTVKNISYSIQKSYFKDGAWQNKGITLFPEDIKALRNMFDEMFDGTKEAA